MSLVLNFGAIHCWSVLVWNDKKTQKNSLQIINVGTPVKLINSACYDKYGSQ